MEKDVAIGVAAGKDIDPMDATYWDIHKISDYFIWVLNKKCTKDQELIVELMLRKLEGQI